MFVASYLAEHDIEAMSDMFNNLNYNDSAEELCDAAHGNVACLSLDPAKALNKAVAMFAAEVADVYEMPVADINVTVTPIEMATGLFLSQFVSAARVDLSFVNVGGDTEHVYAGVVVDNFDPVE